MPSSSLSRYEPPHRTRTMDQRPTRHARAFAIILAVSFPWRGNAAEPAAVPKGEVTKYTFDQSKIFPGTLRDYWVYVPRQYDPARPACVHVNQDGVQFGAPEVFDQLIQNKEMP